MFKIFSKWLPSLGYCLQIRLHLHLSHIHRLCSELNNFQEIKLYNFNSLSACPFNSQSMVSILQLVFFLSNYDSEKQELIFSVYSKLFILKIFFSFQCDNFFNLFLKVLVFKTVNLKKTEVAQRNINSCRYADDTTLMAGREEKLNSLLMRVEKESEKAGLTINIQKKRLSHLIPSLHGK